MKDNFKAVFCQDEITLFEFWNFMLWISLITESNLLTVSHKIIIN